MSLYFKNLSKSRRNSLEKYEIWDVTRHDTGKFEGDPNFTNESYSNKISLNLAA